MRALGRATTEEDDPRANDGTADPPARLRYCRVESIPLRGLAVPCGARAARCARPHAVHMRRVTMTCRRPRSRSKRPNAEQPGGQYVRRVARLGFQPLPPNEARADRFRSVPGLTGRSLRRLASQYPQVPKRRPTVDNPPWRGGTGSAAHPRGVRFTDQKTRFTPLITSCAFERDRYCIRAAVPYLNRHCDNAATLIAETVTAEARHSPVVPWRSLRV